MKEKKSVLVVLLTVSAMAVNVAGRIFTQKMGLPVLFDSFGTVLVAYLLGPVSGAAVGLCGNVAYGLLVNPVSAGYGLTSMVLGILVGISARKGRFESFFGTLTVSFIVTIASVAVSTPLNFIFYGGMTGNVFADGVVRYMLEHGINKVLCCVTGEFYLDFLDKVITLIALVIVIRLRRLITGRMDKNGRGTTAAVLAVLMTAGMAAGLSPHAQALSDAGDVDFYSYVQTLYSSENGLPCGEANDIVQTTDGVLWIGTYSGLYRYSGTEFRPMNEFRSVKNVNCMYVDEEGRLWIGTNDSGLSLSINEKISTVLDINSGLPSNSVRSIVKSSDGYYYVGTSGIMQILELKSGLQLLEQMPQIVYAHSMSADKNGRVAAVTQAGELFIIQNRQIVLEETMPEGQGKYNCCLFDSDGQLYVGASEGRAFLFSVTDEGLKLKRRYDFEGLGVLSSMYKTEDGLLFACANNGVGCFTSSGRYSNLNLYQFRNSIDHMLVDYQGNLWFSSSRLGVLRLAKSSFSDIYASADMEQKVVNSVTKWNGRLYIGTDNGLDIYYPVTRSQTYSQLSQTLKDVRVRCVFADSFGDLWICTYGKGLIRALPDETYRYYSSTEGGFCDWVRQAAQMSDGTVVAAGDAGVAYFRDGEIFRTVPLGPDFTNAMVLCMLDEGDGDLLVGSDGDGIAVLRDGVTVQRVNESDGLTSGVILRISRCGAADGFYVVTSNGLCYMDRDYNVTPLENFPYSNNYDVWARKDGRVFVLSSAGIFVVNEAELLSGAEDLTYEVLDAKRGLHATLTANSWNYEDEGEALYLSSGDGVFMINLADYGSAQRSYRMKMSTINLDGVDHVVEKGTDIVVDRGTVRMELFPEIISYSLEDPFVSYKLEGFDSEEIVLRKSALGSVVYTNLASGRYTFRLCVLNNNREVIEETGYDIVKELEIFDNWWFKVYMLMVGGLAIAWLTWFIARTQIQRTLTFQQKELEFTRQQVKMGNETIIAIAKTVDAKDENTSQHSLRVSEYSVMIGKELGFSDEECENLRKAALLHDLGKIAIPDRVLNKPGRLTDEEYALMKSHVLRGAEILKDFTVVEHVVDGALYHHERYDGKGYVSGLKGEEIPIYGRIIGVADAFDAMTQNRVYRDKLDIDYVLEEMERCRGAQFDPEIDDILLRLVSEKKIDLSVYERPAEEAEK